MHHTGYHSYSSIVRLLEKTVQWKHIHEKVRATLRQVFEAPGLVHPEMHSPTARAMYGVDLMLDANFEPKLLEVNNSPFEPLQSSSSFTPVAEVLYGVQGASLLVSLLDCSGFMM